MLKYINEYLDKSFNGSGILLMDEFAAHKTDNIIELLIDRGINPLFIPAGFTSVLQPLDVSVNKPLKAFYAEYWNEWIGDELIAEYTNTGNSKKPDMQLCLDWISKALLKITPDTIRKSFECCGLKDGDWQSFEHLSLSLQKIIGIKIDLDDIDAEIALLNEFNIEKNMFSETNLINAEDIIASCSNESFIVSKENHLNEIIAACSQEFQFYEIDN